MNTTNSLMRLAARESRISESRSMKRGMPSARACSGMRSAASS